MSNHMSSHPGSDSPGRGEQFVYQGPTARGNPFRLATFWTPLRLAIFCAFCLTFGGLAIGLFYDERPGFVAAKNKIKPGMTKEEVRSLLGRPDEGDYPTASGWSYHATSSGGCTLHIRFDADGCVTSIQ